MPLHGPRAVVLDLAHPRAVAVVRSLARGGIEVVGVDHRRDATGFYSRHLARLLRRGLRYAARPKVLPATMASPAG